MPIHISNLSFLDPKSNKGSRVGFKFLENGKKYVLILLSKNLDDDIEGAEFLAKISLEIFNHLS